MVWYKNYYHYNTNFWKNKYILTFLRQFLRRELAIPADTTFNAVYYKNTDDAEDAEKKTKFSYLKAYHQMRTAFN